MDRAPHGIVRGVQLAPRRRVHSVGRAINRDTGLTLIASADGTTSVVDRGVSSKFGTFVISQATRVQMGDSATADRAVVIERTTPTRTLRSSRSVRSTRAGTWAAASARTASLPGVASAAALGGDALAVVDTSGVVRRYERGRETAVLRFDVVGTTSRPSLVALRRDRLGLVVGSSVAIIDTSDGKLRKARIVNDRDGARFSAVAAFPDGGKLAASMGDGSLVIIDVETGKEVARTMTNAALVRPRHRSQRQADGAGRRAHRCGLHPGRDDAAAGRPRAGGAGLRQQPHVARRRSPARQRVDGRLGALLGHRHPEATRRAPARLRGRQRVRGAAGIGRVLRGRRRSPRVGSRPAAARSAPRVPRRAAT